MEHWHKAGHGTEIPWTNTKGTLFKVRGVLLLAVCFQTNKENSFVFLVGVAFPYEVGKHGGAGKLKMEIDYLIQFIWLPFI